MLGKVGVWLLWHGTGLDARQLESVGEGHPSEQFGRELGDLSLALSLREVLHSSVGQTLC